MNEITEIKGVLFDLDGTLLEMHMSKFYRSYHKYLYPRLSSNLDFGQYLKHYNEAVYKTIANNTGKTNLDVFLDEFLSHINISREKGEAILKAFYHEEYQKLRKYVTPLDKARDVVQRAFEQNLKVIIATTPVFMRDAIKARMNWARIDDLPFDLITFAEEFTTCKPYLDFYRDICDKIKLTPKECLVVGDDHNDLVAKMLGCKTFFIESSMTNLKEDTPQPDFVGNLQDLMELL